ncbi:hypothetical protein PTNB85_07423 [Pyrenophora teres f. teres]|nr:hypothetical protein HRS9139_07455 [Pyrenophora teres f. teres]KAE8830836.1 hypothetical protein PTNB85_07423 [Pyrenophora teres f. teres]KAE8857166.1 hypothetical protein PTNB29_08233 [Pyrenophora teres f. teres]
MDTVRDAVQSIAQGSVARGAGAAALLGVLFHLAIQPIEFELIMYHSMAAFMFTFFGTVYSFGLVKATIFTASFNATLLASISIYRLLFHRCRRFPGPFAARLSKFYAASLAAKDVQYYKELAKLHHLYGDFVRTDSRATRDQHFTQVSRSIDLWAPLGMYQGDAIQSEWEQSEDMFSLGTYEPRIKAKTDLLKSQLVKNAGNPMDISTWSMFFSFDIMGDVGFGKDFNNLNSGVEHVAIKSVHDHMKIVGILNAVPWLTNIISSIPGAAAGYKSFFSFCSDQIREKHQSWDGEEYPHDIISWLLKAVKEKDVSAPQTAAALEDDSRLMIVAGSETTAVTLATALFYLAKHPAKQAKLQHLLNQRMPGGYINWSYEKARSISYLDDIINETLRLQPALMTGGARETPAKGIQIDDTYIPGNTNVVIPISLIQRDRRWWQQAEEFVPERFGELKQEMETEGAPYLPFSLGVYGCPGKNLAMTSLRTALSMIAMSFDFGFAPGETGVRFEEEKLDTLTVTLPPLYLKFTPRESI